MSYVDLARSHVKECLREAFELSSLVVDEDGDIPFTHGTAVYFVTVRGDGQRVKVWSPAVTGLKASAALLREVNELNSNLELARALVRRSRLAIEGVLPVDGLTAQTMGELCVEVGDTADRVGQMISAVHGGQVMLPEGEQGCDQCGS